MSRARRWRGLVGGLPLAVVLALGFGGDGRADQTSQWSIPVNLGEGVNSTFNEDLPHISRDGLSLYFISNRSTGSMDDFDIWVSHLESPGSWGRPIRLGTNINTDRNERGPCLSSDGHYLYFSSNAVNPPKGFGSQDVWVSFRPDTSDDFGWQAPVRLGHAVNTIYPDFGAALIEGDPGYLGTFSALLFGRRDNFEDADIYMSRFVDGAFEPATVVAELSTPQDDLRPTIRPDGLELFFHSNREGSLMKNGLERSHDIWVSRRSSLSAAWSKPKNVGAKINTGADEQFPALSADGLTLIFSSNRTGTSDLWMSTRQAVDDPWLWP